MNRTDRSEPDQAAREAASLEALAKDWIALWQSELAALAADREMHEGWAQMAALWAGAASSAVEAGMRTARHDRASGFSPFHDAARPAPSPAAPDAGRDEIERLNRRIADLEARLLAMERGPKPG